MKIKANNKLKKESIFKETSKYRFNTKNSITSQITWTKDMKYYDLGEFKTFNQIYLPAYIYAKDAVKVIYTIVVGFASLNKSKIKKETLLKLANTCNSRVTAGEPLNSEDIDNIVNSAFKNKETYIVKDNNAVRYIKNPLHKFDVVEMRNCVAEFKRKSDFERIAEAIENWDFEKDGSPSQENLGKKVDFSRRTIIRKFQKEDFPQETKDAWIELKQRFESGMIDATPTEEVKVVKPKFNHRRSDVKEFKVRKKSVKKKTKKQLDFDKFYQSELKKRNKRYKIDKWE